MLSSGEGELVLQSLSLKVCATAWKVRSKAIPHRPVWLSQPSGPLSGPEPARCTATNHAPGVEGNAGGGQFGSL